MRLHPSETADRYLANGWWSGQLLTDLLAERVANSEGGDDLVDPPDRDVLVGGRPRRMSWIDIDEASRNVAAHLIAAGVEVDDVIGVQLPNIAELVITYFALIRIGAIPSPFPIQYHGREVRRLVEFGRMRGIVSIEQLNGEHRADSLVATLKDRPEVQVLAWYGKGDSTVNISDTPVGHDLSVRLRDRESRVDLHPNDAVFICWTSGTGGLPKAVPRSHGDWLASVISTVDVPGITTDDIILCPYPMVNAGGLIGLFGASLMTGARLVLHQPFDLELFVEQIGKERVTYTVGAPTVIERILRTPSLRDSADFSSLRAMGTGSAPIAPRAIVEWEERFHCDVLNFFGANEGVGLVSDPSTVPNAEDRAVYFPRYGTSELTFRARSAAWVRLRLVDDNECEVTATGKAGELRVAGPMIFAGYLGDDDDSAFDEQGYYQTGDMFVIAGDRGQYLRYVGRRKDLIIRGGVNISALEVENIALQHPAVAEVAAIPVPHDVLGEQTGAVVVLSEGATLTLEQLVQHFADHDVAKYKWPEHLFLIDQLPRNPLGKVVKHELRERLSPADRTIP